MNIKNEIKGATAKKGLTLTQAIDRMNEKYNRKQTLQNISNKLNNNTIRFNEVFELLDSIGYEIQIVEKPFATVDDFKQYVKYMEQWDEKVKLNQEKILMQLKQKGYQEGITREEYDLFKETWIERYGRDDASTKSTLPALLNKLKIKE